MFLFSSGILSSTLHAKPEMKSHGACKCVYKVIWTGKIINMLNYTTIKWIKFWWLVSKAQYTFAGNRVAVNIKKKNCSDGGMHWELWIVGRLFLHLLSVCLFPLYIYIQNCSVSHNKSQAQDYKSVSAEEKSYASVPN